MNRTPIAIALAVTLFALAAPRAHAEEETRTIVTGVAALTAFATVGIPGIVTAIHNGIDASSGELTSGWRAAGYVFGALNLAASIGLAAGSEWGRSGGWSGFRVAYTVGPLVVGGVNLGISIYDSARDRGHGTKISLVPIAGGDRQTGAFGGIGVKIASF